VKDGHRNDFVALKRDRFFDGENVSNTRIPLGRKLFDRSLLATNGRAS
jgi:hypothetical protein